jgi:hypothetical protein
VSKRVITAIICGFALIAVALVYTHQTYLSLRESIVLTKDLFVAFLTLSILGVGVENLRRSAVAARAAVALRFVERWNDPTLAPFRTDWHKLYDEFKTLTAPQVVERLKSDQITRDKVTDVLNFFEEVSYAVKTNAADRILLEELLGDTIREYFSIALPWVKERRKTRPDAWIQIETCWPGKFRDSP